MVKIMKASDLKHRLSSGDVVLVDVREPHEHHFESINGAHLVPLGDISYTKLPTKKSGPIVIHCKSGRRSEEACKKLLAENPDLELYSLEGGIVAWKEAGGSVNNKSGTISLERQTQIVAGSLALTGAVLGFLVSYKFHFLSGFVGAGLTFAGITGWCGTTKLLAKMPWNNKNK